MLSEPTQFRSTQSLSVRVLQIIKHLSTGLCHKWLLLSISTLLSSALFTAQADEGLDWPYFYDPEVVQHLHFKIKDEDWNTIKADDTYDIEVPVLFWVESEGEESAILVSIRRKSATPIGSKVSFKIDINEYDEEDPRAVGKWHKLKKLSLENGDDQDVVSEALAWYLHRLATSPISQVYPVGHVPGLASWVTLTAHVVPSCFEDYCQAPFDFEGSVSIEPQGVYVNVEQPDKQYLKNRNIWTSDQTWLYKQDDIGAPERKEVGCEDFDEEGDSPTTLSLQCSPFLGSSGKGRNKFVPNDCTPEQLNAEVNMNTMLAQGAVEAFSSNADGMLTHGKNFYWTDRSDPSCSLILDETKRSFFPWDLDAAIATSEANVYGKMRKKRGIVQTEYQRVILGEQSYRDMYNHNLDILTSPTFIQSAIGYLDLMEPVLTPLLEADPNSKMDGNVSGHFDGLRTWLQSRSDNIQSQLCSDDSNYCAP